MCEIKLSVCNKWWTHEVWHSGGSQRQQHSKHKKTENGLQISGSRHMLKLDISICPIAIA